MSQEELGLIPGGRYYPNTQEQNILISGLHEYFSQPERSPNRNKIAKEVSTILRRLSPHWTHRAVRLWFNNNRKTYLSDNSHINQRSPCNLAMVSPSLHAFSYLNQPTHIVEPTKYPYYAYAPPLAMQDNVNDCIVHDQGSAEGEPVVSSISKDSKCLLASKINEIYQTDEGDPWLSSRVAEYNQCCKQLYKQQQIIDPESLESAGHFIHFPELLDSFSSSDSDSPPSFTQSPFNDHSSENVFWQEKAFEDEKITHYDSSIITSSVAAYSHASATDNSKQIIYVLQRDSHSWEQFEVEFSNHIEHMSSDGENIWCLGGTQLAIVSGPQCCLQEGHGSPSLDSYDSQCVIGYSSTSKLYLVSNKLQSDAINVLQIPLNWSGVTSSILFNKDRILFSPTEGNEMRLLNTTFNKEEHVFVGHCQQILSAKKYDNNCFITISADYTTRLWDVRERKAAIALYTPSISVVDVSGSGNYLVCAFNPNLISAFDIRADLKRPVVGVRVHNYETSIIHYDADKDILSLFATWKRNQKIGSMIFVDSDYSGRKRIFRSYPNFLQ